ncbi:hypothetical protein OHA77_15520 [Streptosporangium sp. NBC_01639]|uniref:hypothetical protein n=1 Tax=Streptosporangium sp. NBC_01639 TaxID=2975948 RepID=UPI003868F49E|nr:hypothetical protein OHA77_15520 [Streptosporangium sp. NBC_01639]
MGFPGEPPRRQPYVQPDAPPPAQGERWFEPAPRGRDPRGSDSAPGHAPDGSGSVPGRDPRGSERAPYGRAPEQAPHGDDPRGAHPADTAKPAQPEQPRQAMWSPYDEGPRSRMPIFVAVGALGLLIAGGIGLAMLAGSDPPADSRTASPPTQDPGVPIPNGPNDKFGFAASRTTDPTPLSLNEVFKHKAVTMGRQKYAMTTRRLDKKCKDAVVGDKLQKALTAGKCTQLLRASFRDASGTIIGTVGVANLKTSAAASKVISAGAGKSREEYLKALPGKDKVTKFLGTGEAFAGGWSHGHYAVMVWFQYKDGHLPKKTEVKKLNQAAFGATDATVTPVLESRSLTGGRS